MFLTILFIILLLSGITIVLIKWKGAVSIVPLVLCFAGIILVLYLNTSEKKKEQADKKVRDLNLIEYVSYLNTIDRSPELNEAVTTANVNMREIAAIKGKIICSVPNGTHIQLVSPSPVKGWFHVLFEDNRGWIYGKYLKNGSVLTSGISTVQVSRKSIFLYIFPERTWWGKLLGLLLGLSISLYLALMGYCDMLTVKRFGISWGYFMIKNIYIFIGSYPEILGFTTLLGMIMASTLVAFVVNALSNVSLNIIDQYKFKAISQ